ncbi:MAG: AIR synthase related protein [Candidatus Sigynarchaeota archaeon]
MTDLEGIANHMLDANNPDEAIIDRLKELYKLFKPALDESMLLQLSKSVLEEVKKSRVGPREGIIKDILTMEKAVLTIGEQGVGCRGMGDFVAHEFITKMASTGQSAFLAPQSMDDAGAVVINSNDGKKFIVTKMEGMHSRLSNYPFIAGFHVARACLRDLLVKGARPISMMVDIHLGDDCDISKLFDFMAGVSCVAELAGVPITAGSTLRIGGDMVIGDRITGGIAGVGICDRILARKDIALECDILMTEGAGGGTIATTAIYNSQPDAIVHTLNIKFVQAINALLDRQDLLEGIYCCSDVTNGGLRGDLFEILRDSNLGADVHEPEIRALVNKDVLDLLDSTGTDYLGVSLDALLVFCKPTFTSAIIAMMGEKNIKVKKIGQCKRGKGIQMHLVNGCTVEMVPRFRESAYTPIKKVIGEKKDASSQERMNALVQGAYQSAIDKKRRILDWITKSNAR